MNAKHTPGPWKLGYGSVEASDKTPIAAVRLYGGNMAAESDANAALIAAAPDLLAALRVMVERMERAGREANALDAMITDKARAAIAKADGQQ